MKYLLNAGRICPGSGTRRSISSEAAMRKTTHCEICGRALRIRPVRDEGGWYFATLPRHSEVETVAREPGKQKSMSSGDALKLRKLKAQYSELSRYMTDINVGESAYLVERNLNRSVNLRNIDEALAITARNGELSKKLSRARDAVEAAETAADSLAAELEYLGNLLSDE